MEREANFGALDTCAREELGGRVRHIRRAYGIALAIIASLVVVAHVSSSSSAASHACPIVGGKRTCLKVGQVCKPALEPVYRRHGFHCGAGRRLVHLPTRPAPRRVSLSVVGTPTTVFDWTTDRCEDNDIPDLPA